jgi:DNA-binding response OmpR family regulator
VTEEAPVVLVADDDPDLRGLVVYRLERAGYRVLEAENGEEALRLAREERPDIAVLDVMMPRLTGVDVLRALRADDETRDTRVILLTAKSQEQDVSAGFGAGADDYVTKPFSPTELQARIAAILARR